MNRSLFFAVGLAATVICLIVAIVYLTGGTPLGHHIKHAILFFGLTAVALVFTLANRPVGALS